MDEPIYLFYMIVFLSCLFGLFVYNKKQQIECRKQFYRKQLNRTNTGTKRKKYVDPSFDQQKFLNQSFEKIKQYADFLFRFSPDQPINVSLVTSHELYRITRPFLSNYPSDLIGFCVREENQIKIFVLKGLPPEQLFITLAHEYAHAWQIIEGFLGGQEERKEGFAEWFAYKIAELNGYDAEFWFPPQDRSSCYSGLKKFRTIEERFGFFGAVRAAKSSQLNLKVLR